MDGLHAFFKGVGDAAQSFHAEQLAPALDAVNDAVQHFHTEQLTPALTAINDAAQHFHAEQLSPSLKVADDAAQDFRTNQLSPAFKVINDVAQDFHTNQLSPALKDFSGATRHFHKQLSAPVNINRIKPSKTKHNTFERLTHINQVPKDVCDQLARILDDPARHREFLSRKDEKAQSTLNKLQAVRLVPIICCICILLSGHGILNRL